MNEPTTLTQVSFDSLVGTHELSGVAFGTAKPDPKEYYQDDYDTCSFVLDGIVYTPAEDPSDGYRSSMRSLTIGGEVGNRFAPQTVLCSLQAESNENGWHQVDDLLIMRDAVTGKEVLAIGTTNTDDYYPCYTARFDPTAMACNALPAPTPGDDRG